MASASSEYGSILKEHDPETAADGHHDNNHVESPTEIVMDVLKTFGTYMTADFLSNFLQHPKQKLDYGCVNYIFDREVESWFYGTRFGHIVGVAAGLAITDHLSQYIMSKYILHQPLAFATTPKAFVVHTFLFIFVGVTLYAGCADALFNPSYTTKEERWDAFYEGTYKIYVGANTAWFEPFVTPTLALLIGSTYTNNWLCSALIPATFAYATVKGVGWTDWGYVGLNMLEMRLNHMTEK